MKVHAIDVEKLKREGELSSLWYQFDDGDLYLLIGKSHVEYFEFTKGDKHLEGGKSRSLKFGKIVETQVDEPAQFYKRSRLLEYQNELDEELLKWSQRFMFECPNVENSLKEGIMEYLEHRGEKNDLLSLAEGEYESYRHPKAPSKPKISLSRRLRQNKKLIFITLLLWPIFFFIHQKRVATDEELLERCRKGETDVCKRIQEAQLVTLDKNIGKTKAPRIAKKSKDYFKECIENNDCDFDYLKEFLEEKQAIVKKMPDQEKFKSDLEKQLTKSYQVLCVQKARPWACEALVQNYLDEEAKDKLLKQCQSEEIDKNACESITKEVQFSRDQVKCLANARDESCLNYYRQLIAEGKIAEYEIQVQGQCDFNRGEFCFEIAKHYFSDEKHPNYNIRKRAAMRNWKKGCFKLNNPKSCYYYSANAGEPVDFKEEKARKKILKLCLQGTEELCQRLKSIAEGYL